MRRIATALVLAPLLWLTIKMAPSPVFSVLALAAIGGACVECYRMLEAAGGRPLKGLGLLGALALGWSFMDLAPRFEPALALGALVAGTLVLAMACREAPADMLSTARDTLFPVLFVGLSLAFLVGLRAVPSPDGQDLLLLLFCCVILADTLAYYVGSSIGRRRMAPRLSPNKSWEGAAAGMFGSVLGGILAHVWFYQRLPLAHALALGMALGLAAILGDLAESMVKRAVGVKDSSGLFPGHGGLLDRTDSLLFSGPLLYYYYRFFLQGAA
jgi:phosphatidate cytidylyltransferase